MANDNFPSGYALIIGVGRDLPDTVNDANVLHKILIDPKKAGYPTDQVQLITEGEATKQGIINALEELVRQTKGKNDATVLIYYSGHGGQIFENNQEQYILVPNDYTYANNETWLFKEDFSTLVNQINSQKIMLIFDCCHADGVKGIGPPPNNLKQDFKPLVDGLGAGSGRVVMASCKADEKSFIDRKSNHGIFTLALIEALEGKNTMDKKKYISFEDICQYLRTEVPVRAFDLMKKPQTPVFNMTDFTGFDVCFYNSYIPPKPLVFIISDKRDNTYLNELQQSMQSYVAKGLIERWDISQIPPAELVDEYSKNKLKEADLILCLLSYNYFSSKKDICINLQNLAFLQRKKIIPILLNDCDYELYEEFNDLQVLPIENNSDEPLAIVNWQNRSSAYLKIGKSILKQVQEEKKI